MTSDPIYSGEAEEEPEPDLDPTELPEQPQWLRCGAVHSVERGPWVGTLVCCMRKGGHTNEHLMTLGDAGTPEYWQEFWL
jgi:hypothetical protein